ncbi:tetratricopeptide repeat protein [Rhodocaloribacter sp.]
MRRLLLIAVILSSAATLRASFARTSVAQEAGDDPGARLARLAVLSDSLRQTDLDEAIRYARAGKTLAARLDSTFREALFDLRLGSLFQDRSRYDSAAVHLNRALAVFEASGDLVNQANALHLLEANVKNQGEYVEAMTYGLRALRLWEALGDERGIARAYAQISDELYYQERYEEAIDYCNRALAIHTRLGDTEDLIQDYQYLGENYLMLNRYEAALTSLNRALELGSRLERRPTRLASLYNSRGNVFKHMKRYEEAQADYQRSLALILPLDFLVGISAVKANIADVLMRQNHYAEALPYLLESLRIQEETNFIRNLPENYLHTSQVYEALGRFPEALAYHKRFAAVRDSLLNMEKDQVMSELRTRYESERKENIIERQQHRLSEQQIVQRFSLGVLALLGVILFLVYSGYRSKRKANARLRDVNAQLTREAALRAEVSRRDAERAREIESAYTRLKATQQQLIQAEKMASLGALTAGIAHEIKNPLNFVNNFAELNEELVDELSDALADDRHLSRDDLLDVLADLKQNAAIIAHHGKRADGIVRAMMQHARGGSGGREAIDLNALVREYAGLAYHGKRAQMPEFNVEIVTDFDEALGVVEVAPQEMGRVLLNLLGNAFDAVHEHAARSNGVYAPKVIVSTRRLGDHVEIRVADNGPGIAPEVRDRIFEPFFTTKPTGSGTGLGLSLSYDIVTQGHGGTLTVESTPGKGATFVVTLPEPA